MNIIYKYQLFPYSRTVSMPRNSCIRKIGMQDGDMFFWVRHELNPSQYENRNFEVYGTGQVIPNNLHYIDTVFEREMVWHVFEVLPEGQP